MEIGKVYFDKYRILELLGEGGTSQVYLAENIRLGNRWAIKKAFKGQNLINLLAEPNILKQLNHPAIPIIIDIEEDEEAIYIIEEYVDGILLKTYKLAKEVIEEKQIIDWALQLCDVLKYLHNRKPNPIIYRDLKPENIILMPDGMIKLIDFGIAREYKKQSHEDTVPIGTKGYAAPEQYGIGQSDERTDIFSLGMTLFFLLTGKNLSHPPYQIQLNDEINISTTLKNIVLKCCEVLPNQRYQNVDAVIRDLLPISTLTAKGPLSEEEPNKKVKIKEKGRLAAFKKTITVGFIGVASGVGVTHNVVMMANLLSKKYRVAVVELNTSKHFREIGKTVEDKKRLVDNHFKYQKVDYYWDIPFADFVSRYRDSVDIVILDFGAVNAVRDIYEFIRCDYRFVCAHGVDWKIREIESFYQKMSKYDSSNYWIYLIPFLDKKAIKDISKRGELNMVAVPFNMNPFEPGQDVKKIFEHILFNKKSIK